MASWGLSDRSTALFSLTPPASWQCQLVWSDWLRTGSLTDILFLLVTNLGNLGVNTHSLGFQIDMV